MGFSCAAMKAGMGGQQSVLNGLQLAEEEKEGLPEEATA